MSAGTAKNDTVQISVGTSLLITYPLRYNVERIKKEIMHAQKIRDNPSDYVLIFQDHKIEAEQKKLPDVSKDLAQLIKEGKCVPLTLQRITKHGEAKPSSTPKIHVGQSADSGQAARPSEGTAEQARSSRDASPTKHKREEKKDKPPHQQRKKHEQAAPHTEGASEHSRPARDMSPGGHKREEKKDKSPHQQHKKHGSKLEKKDTEQRDNSPQTPGPALDAQLKQYMQGTNDFLLAGDVLAETHRHLTTILEGGSAEPTLQEQLAKYLSRRGRERRLQFDETADKPHRSSHAGGDGLLSPTPISPRAASPMPILSLKIPSPATSLSPATANAPSTLPAAAAATPPPAVPKEESKAADQLPLVEMDSTFEIAWEQLEQLCTHVIGEGGFAIVYKTVWNGQEVAVKKLKTEDLDIEDFKKEVSILSRTSHPNIVRFVGGCTRMPHLAIVTEFVARGNLCALLADPSVSFPWSLKIRIATDVAKGMHYLHTRTPKIIHRDLKTENIFIDKDWSAKIGDFGLAKLKISQQIRRERSRAAVQQLLHKEESKISIAESGAVGTPAYIAPEIMELSPYSEKADVYSYGIILWELLTRQQPFSDMGNYSIAMAVLVEQERPPIPPSCPKKFRELITDCWNNEPSCRPDFQVITQILTTIGTTEADWR